MNNKGQSLVFLVALIPLILIVFAFVFDTSLIIREKNRLESITMSAINYITYNNKTINEVEDVIKKNDPNIEILILNNEKISLKKEIKPVFGKILGFDTYKVKDDKTFKMNDGKVFIMEKGN